MTLQHDTPHARRERYLAQAREAESLAASAADAFVRQSYLVAADSWRMLARLVSSTDDDGED